MPIDKLDIKIQEAAARNQPAFEENAWVGMEKLLDEHLPQKKNDKRKFIWLFLLLFLCLAILLVIIKPWNTEGKALQYPGENIVTALSDIAFGKASHSTFSNKNPIMKGKIAKNIFVIKRTISPIIPLINQTTFIENPGNSNGKINKLINDIPAGIAVEESGNGANHISATNSETVKSNIELQQPIISPEIKQSGNKNMPAKEIAKDSPAKQKIPHEKIVSKNKNIFRNSFSLNFSAGPGVSAVDIGDIGKINPVFGAGAGYSVGKKWTLRTGFYVTRKVYNASPSYYNPPAGFWNRYPNLNYINADCKIFEVPLLVNYNFAQTSTHRWFAAAGLSSYFMKKEEYDYFSKNYAGQYLYDSYTVSNKNRHYFSSLRLSGGYERNINHAISINAEPYLNLPLSGIGYGKVRLYSAGVLFTFSIKPFAKK